MSPRPPKNPKPQEGPATDDPRFAHVAGAATLSSANPNPPNSKPHMVKPAPGKSPKVEVIETRFVALRGEGVPVMKTLRPTEKHFDAKTQNSFDRGGVIWQLVKEPAPKYLYEMTPGKAKYAANQADCHVLVLDANQVSAVKRANFRVPLEEVIGLIRNTPEFKSGKLMLYSQYQHELKELIAERAVIAQQHEDRLRRRLAKRDKGGESDESDEEIQ